MHGRGPACVPSSKKNRCGGSHLVNAPAPMIVGDGAKVFVWATRGRALCLVPEGESKRVWRPPRCVDPSGASRRGIDDRCRVVRLHALHLQFVQPQLCGELGRSRPHRLSVDVHMCAPVPDLPQLQQHRAHEQVTPDGRPLLALVQPAVLRRVLYRIAPAVGTPGR